MWMWTRSQNEDLSQPLWEGFIMLWLACVCMRMMQAERSMCFTSESLWCHLKCKKSILLFSDYLHMNWLQYERILVVIFVNIIIYTQIKCPYKNMLINIFVTPLPDLYFVHTAHAAGKQSDERASEPVSFCDPFPPWISHFPSRKIVLHAIYLTY